MIKRILTLALLSLTSLSQAQVDGDVVEAREPLLNAYFAADSVGIGDPITLSLEVEQDIMQVVAFPDFDMGEESPLEMIAPPELDTLAVEGRRVRLRRKYNFRTFDAGLYNIGVASVLYTSKGGVDTLTSGDSLRFMVGTFLIDSTSHSIFDLKPVRMTPFKFQEVSGYVTWSVIGLIVLGAVLLLLLKLLARLGRPVMGLFKPAPPVPPHVAAFAALDELRAERLWQEGEYKGYYSRLTDILRTYISGRYGVAAMEMTTDETIVALRDLELPTQCEMELRDLLRDADLVKFAKAEFEGSLNERYYESARQFVEQTRELDEEELKALEEEQEDEN